MDFRADSERNYLGVIWWVLDPLIMMAVFYLVFGVFMRRNIENFVPFLLIGLVMWRWFETSVRQIMNSIVRNRSFVERLAFHKLVFPVSTLLTQTFQFLFSLIILFVVLNLYGIHVNVYYLAFLPILLIELLLICAVGFPLAAIVPFVPDVEAFFIHVLRILFYFSGIFYVGRDLSEKIQWLFWLNPMANVLEAQRQCLMYQQWPDWRPMLIISGCSVVAVYVGAFLMWRYGKTYAKGMMT